LACESEAQARASSPSLALRAHSAHRGAISEKRMGRIDQLERPTHVRYAVLAIACALAVLTYVQRQGFVAGTPYIQRDLRLDDVQMGLLLAGWLVAYGIFQVPGGLLGDRLGSRHLLTILVLGWSTVLASVALIALLPAEGWLAFPLLFVLRFLFGSFQAGGFPALARVIATGSLPGSAASRKG